MSVRERAVRGNERGTVLPQCGEIGVVIKDKVHTEWFIQGLADQLDFFGFLFS